MNLKYYDDSRILRHLFTLEIIQQVFGAVGRDDGIRLGHIFFFLPTFLLVT